MFSNINKTTAYFATVQKGLQRLYKQEEFDLGEYLDLLAWLERKEKRVKNLYHNKYV